MKGISREALKWALDALKHWSAQEPPGTRVKQVIYRLFLLRELGVTTGSAHGALSTADFQEHCRRFLRVSDDSLSPTTGGKSYYLVPTTCAWALAEGGSDWAVGTMWTRCQTWSEKEIISWPEPSGARTIRFAPDYISKLKTDLDGVKMPGLALALFLLRDPTTTKIPVDGVKSPRDLIDLFRTSFKLSDKNLESVVDFSTTSRPTGSIIDSKPLSPADILALAKDKIALPIAVAEPAPPDSSPAHQPIRHREQFTIPTGEKRGAASLPLQLLVHGCPGTGKSFLLKSWGASLSRAFTVVFHPETTYGDFVGVYRPLSVFREMDEARFLDEAGRVREHGEPYMTYDFVPGPLLRAYATAWCNPDESVALIIEEMSRGNASLVFGDTLQLLDRSEVAVDGFAEGISTYAVTPRAEVLTFLVRHGIPQSDLGVMRFPPNLHIWASMNRSDQNARQLDAAFLRRWEKMHLSHTIACSYGKTVVQVPGGSLEWDELRRRINKELEPLVPEDKFVGPYFLPSKRLADPKAVAEDLLGYLWNDVLKSRAKDVFAVPTLTDALSAWAAGSSNPLRIKLD